MSRPELALLVRMKSRLPHDEALAIADERAPEFAALPDLEQKYYLHNPETGEFCGLYLWKSAEGLAAYRESELRRSIAAAYQAEEPPTIEVFQVVKTLRPS